MTGKVFKADKELIIVSRVIGVETSRVYAEMVKGTAASSIADLAKELASKIATVVAQKAETLVAKTEDYDQRVARIKKSLPARTLPTDLGKNF